VIADPNDRDPAPDAGMERGGGPTGTTESPDSAVQTDSADQTDSAVQTDSEEPAATQDAAPTSEEIHRTLFSHG